MKYGVLTLLVLGLAGCDSALRDYPERDAPVPLALVWSAPYQDRLDAINLEPVVVAGHVLTGADRRVAALDPETGDPVWAVARPSDGGRADVPGGTGETEWATDGRAVFLSPREGRAVHAYDVASGRALWTGAVPDSLRLFPGSQGAADDAAVYAFADAGRAGYVVRLAKDDGRVLGVFDVPGVAKTALRVGGTLVVGTDWGGTDDGAGAVVGLDPETGAERWRYEVTPGTGGFSYAPLRTDGRRVWAGTVFGSGMTVCLDAATGAVVWEQAGHGTAEADLAETPDGLRYFTNSGTTARAYDAETGGVVWSRRFEGYGEDNLAYHDGVVYHSRGYTLHAFDAATGETITSVTPSGGPTWDVEVDPARGVLYLMTSAATEARRLLTAEDRARLAAVHGGE